MSESKVKEPNDLPAYLPPLRKVYYVYQINGWGDCYSSLDKAHKAYCEKTNSDANTHKYKRRSYSQFDVKYEYPNGAYIAKRPLNNRPISGWIYQIGSMGNVYSSYQLPQTILAFILDTHPVVLSPTNEIIGKNKVVFVFPQNCRIVKRKLL